MKQVPTSAGNNVAHITSFRRTAEQQSSYVLGKLPKPILTLKQHSDAWLADKVSALLTRVDDTLFELANNSYKQQEQDAFFYAMKELRQERTHVIDRFKVEVTELYSALLDMPEEAQENLESLSVIENDEMDELLAIAATVKRANHTVQFASECLMERIEAVCPCGSDIKLLPISVENICHAFKRATQALELEATPRLVLFKLLEKDVIGDLSGLYEEMNELLVERGILPSLERTKGKRPAAKTDSNSRLVQSDHVVPTQKAYSQESYRQDAQPSPQQPTGAESMQNIDSVALNGQQPYQPSANIDKVETLQLLGLLKDIQAQVGASSFSGGQSVVQLLAEHDGFEQSPAIATEMQTMQLVDGLFENVLTEQNLANPLKALLAKLQLPLVRAAVADDSLLKSKEHSGRQLMNALAQAGLAWRPDDHVDQKSLERDPLFKKMNDIVDRAANEYDENGDIFTQLLREFHSFTQREKKRLALLERHMQDAEEGKAKTENARLAVTDAIVYICAGRDLHSTVYEIVHTAWHKVMFMFFVKYGESSEQWQSSVDTLTRLIDSTHNLKSLFECEKSRSAYPAIAGALLKGFEQIEFDAFTAERLLNELKHVFANLEPLAAPALPTADTAPVAPEAIPNEQVENTHANNAQNENVQHENAAAQNAGIGSVDAEALKDQSISDSSKPYANDTEEPIDNVMSSSQTSDAQNASVAKNINKLSGEKTEDKQVDTQVTAIEDRYMKLAQSIARGTWVDYHSSGELDVRCRLAAVIGDHRTYIFVNRTGHKVLEKTLNDLAIALKSEELKVVDSGQLFDRALETVIIGLRKNDIPQC